MKVNTDHALLFNGDGFRVKNYRHQWRARPPATIEDRLGSALNLSLITKHIRKEKSKERQVGSSLAPFLSFLASFLFLLLLRVVICGWVCVAGCVGGCVPSGRNVIPDPLLLCPSPPIARAATRGTWSVTSRALVSLFPSSLQLQPGIRDCRRDRSLPPQGK